jgi:hypothetical protein
MMSSLDAPSSGAVCESAGLAVSVMADIELIRIILVMRIVGLPDIHVKQARFRR